MEARELNENNKGARRETWGLSVDPPIEGGRADFVPLEQLQPKRPRLDLDAIRARLAGMRGRQYWRSLDELANTEEFQQYMEREFPNQAPRDMSPLSRREFLRVMGATLALAGAVGGCAYQPPEQIVPYVDQPETLVPGKPLFFTTTFVKNGYGLGVLGESHMGRPVKIEGNPEHPASRGSTDLFAQASILNLYDPDRSQNALRLGELSTWDVFVDDLTDKLAEWRRGRGAGLRILVEPFTSPTLMAQLKRLQKAYPEARVHLHDPSGRDSVREGARLAFGTVVNPIYHLDVATRILSLDSDFLVDEPGSVRYSRDYINKRRVTKENLPEIDPEKANRLYVVESTPTLAGANADHRISVKPSAVEAAARAVAAGLGVAGAAGGATPPEIPVEWISAVVEDLKAHGGTALVIPGVGQPPVVHALAHAINASLGAVGKTVTYTEPVEATFDADKGSLASLVADLKAGQVKALVILGSNPVYTAPADLDFRAALEAAPYRIHLGLYNDETAQLCHWHLPASHYLETWSDARAYDGTTSIVQPLVTPLYSSHSAHELLAALLGEGDRAGYDIVRDYWLTLKNGRRAAPANAMPADQPNGAGLPMVGVQVQDTVSPQFEQFWRQALLDGFIANTTAKPASVTAKGTLPAASPAGTGIEVVFRPDPHIGVGDYSNNGWLQELPKPFSKLTWDNAVYVSPATAQKLGVSNDDVVSVAYKNKSVEGAIWILPGHPADTVTLHLGYGRERAGQIGNKMGFNAYAIRTSDTPWFGTGADVKKTGKSYHLVTAQHHYSQEGRHIVQVGSIEALKANPSEPEFMHREEHEHPLPTLYPEMWPSDQQSHSQVRPGAGAGHEGGAAGHAESGAGHAEGGEHAPEGRKENPGSQGAAEREVGKIQDTGYNGLPVPAWGMVIDLTACIGCNVCTVACQAENNIATVGKEQVNNSREMHWIRIDEYFDDLDNPDRVFQPMACQHCEKAPCEPVCPVEATSHSAEGINEMTYNRCVGTRYCSNNCPYKVRRFNYLQYSDQKTPTLQMMRNPDVTVRSRGVMEKCTYCIQRINEARIEAEKEDRKIRDGDIVTACAQACPTQAIVFGDTADTESHGGKGSLVRQLKEQPTAYGVLTELNTRPRTSYLARLKNPNPKLASASHGGGSHEGGTPGAAPSTEH